MLLDPAPRKALFLQQYAVSVLRVWLLWWAMCPLVLANTSAEPIQISRGPEPLLSVLVNDQPIEAVLTALSAATQMPIRFNVLATARLSKHCVAPALLDVLRCLMGDGINVVQSAEGVWLLENGQVPTTAQKVVPKPAPSEAFTEAFEQLQQQLNRRQALAALTPHHRQFYSAVEAALASTDASLRAQAIAKLAKMDSPAAEVLLYRGLTDVAPLVRLQAVESADQKPALLATASHDADSAVRALAHLKLQQLSQ